MELFTINAVQGTPEWLAARKNGIGGSDAAAIMGCSKYKTAYQTYLDKIGASEEIEVTEPMKWGHIHEPAIIAEYAKREGRIVTSTGLFGKSPVYPFMLASLDAVTECRRIVDAKTSRYGDGFGEAGSDYVPDDYLMQMQHYMIATGARIADIAVLIAGSEYRTYTINFNENLANAIVQNEAQFWQNVQARTEPSDLTHDDLVAKYRTSKGIEVQANDDVMHFFDEMLEAKKQQAHFEAIATIAKAKIMAHMGEADTLKCGDKTLTTWRTGVGRKTLDADGLRKSHPDIAKQFTKISNPSRTFLIKNQNA
jgi:putative phage-type endonuclease